MGFCPFSLESLWWSTQVRRSLSEKVKKSSVLGAWAKKWKHGIERLPQGKDVDSVAICAQRLCRVFTTTSNPDLPPQNFCSSPENIDSPAVHADTFRIGTWQATLVYRYSSRCDAAPTASAVFYLPGSIGMRCNMMAEFAFRCICLSCRPTIATSTCA